MFFAFNRLEGSTSVDNYTFMLVPEGVPLLFPKLTTGYVAYRVGFSSNISYKKLMASGLTIVVLLFGVMVVFEIIKKREGPIHSLTDMKEMTGATPMTENLPSVTVAGERIEPKMNVYSSEGESTKTYNYILGNKEDVWLYFYFGIPDNGDFKGVAF